MERVLRKIEKLVPEKLYKAAQPAYHFGLAAIGNTVYAFPGRKLKVIGVTGTNGKTTSCVLIAEMLKNAGFKVGVTTTNYIEIGGKRVKKADGYTTQGRFKLQRLLSQMLKEGCDWAVVEVTSHGLKQFRLLGIEFDVAVFTNLNHEHLDFHKTMDNYRDAKALLFKGLADSRPKGVPKTIVANTDCSYGDFYLSFGADQKFAFGLEDKETGVVSGLFAKNIHAGLDGTSFDVDVNGQNEHFFLGLLGRHNVYNALAAIGVGEALGISLETIKESLAKTKLVEGRMEKVSAGTFNVFIDYALTPAAVEKLLSSIKELAPGRVIAVFGCAGERDTLKRPEIGRLAAKLADRVLVTDDEPYREDPEKIIADILKDIKNNPKVSVERDRQKAIGMALFEAGSGDAVVIFGMGHETARNIGGKLVPWNDKTVVEKVIVQQKIA